MSSDVPNTLTILQNKETKGNFTKMCVKSFYENKIIQFLLGITYSY